MRFKTRRWPDPPPSLKPITGERKEVMNFTAYCHKCHDRIEISSLCFDQTGIAVNGYCHKCKSDVHYLPTDGKGPAKLPKVIPCCDCEKNEAMYCTECVYKAQERGGKICPHCKAPMNVTEWRCYNVDAHNKAGIGPSVHIEKEDEEG